MQPHRCLDAPAEADYAAAWKPDLRLPNLPVPFTPVNFFAVFSGLTSADCSTYNFNDDAV